MFFLLLLPLLLLLKLVLYYIWGHFVRHLNDLPVADIFAPLTILLRSVLNQLCLRVLLQIRVSMRVLYRGVIRSLVGTYGTKTCRERAYLCCCVVW